MTKLSSVLALFLMLTLAGSLQAEPRNFQEIINSGNLRVGMSLFEPWVMRGKKQQFIGSEPDLARKLAKDMGLKLSVTELQWQELIPALEAGEIDIIISGMSISPSRALKVNFSDSYASSGIGLASNMAKTEQVSSLQELQSADVSIGVVAGTVAEELAERLFPQARKVSFTDFQQAADSLVKAKLHVLLADNPLPNHLALRYPDKIDAPLTEPLLISKEAFAIRKGDIDFLNFLNVWINVHQDDSWLTSVRYYWFETLRWKPMVAE